MDTAKILIDPDLAYHHLVFHGLVTIFWLDEVS
jgi:hypothetical protein